MENKNRIFVAENGAKHPVNKLVLKEKWGPRHLKPHLNPSLVYGELLDHIFVKGCFNKIIKHLKPRLHEEKTSLSLPDNYNVQ